ncbi:MAG: hypothetical protein IPO93_04970 [Actinobacteria bacterium]|nr:hypothetical protein [Actinomycetota bacterium]
MASREISPVAAPPSTQEGGSIRLFRPLRDLESDLQRIPALWWVVGVAGSYLVFEAWILVRHVLWRDEAQLWLVARASGSLGELLSNMNYENRPILWFLLIWPVARLTANPDAVKLLSWLASAGVAVLVTRFLPLARIEQVVVLSGFLFLLGYSTMSTGYVVGTLLTLLWFLAFSRGSLAGQFVVAALMASVHGLFLLLAAPLWALTTIALLRQWRTIGAARRWWAGGAAAASAVVFAWSAWLVVPPVDYSYQTAHDVPWSEAPWRLIEYASDAVRPPSFDVLTDSPTVRTLVWAAPLLAIVIVALLCGRIRLLAPITGLSLLVVNGVFWYGPFWWHWGVIVVALMLIVLMTRDIAGPTWFVTPLLWQTIAWWAVLAAQILALFGAPGDALWGSQPLSGSKEAARVVTQYCPSGCAVITDDDVVATGVSAYLGGQSLYHVNSSRWASFTRWDPGLVAQRPPTWGLVQAALLEKGPGSIAVLSLLRTPPDGFDVLEEPIEAVLAEETFLVVRLAK